jgi:multisubunit Na+/H+ antiporter MnhG subunit
MGFIALIIATIAALFLVISAISFLKAKDVFTMTHVVMVANCYVIPLMLVGVGIDRFSITSITKIITLIALNLVVANLLCHIILRRAIINKIEPDAKKVMKNI